MARHYPPGVAAEIDPSRYPSLVAMFEESFKAHAARKACICMGKAMTYAELDVTSRAFAAWLQEQGLQARRPRRHHDAERAAISGGDRRRSARRHDVVNVNPLYKPRELEFQLKDSGAEVIIVLENFASVLQEALPLTDVKHVVIASMGDMLGRVKGAVVNGVVRHVLTAAILGGQAGGSSAPSTASVGHPDGPAPTAATVRVAAPTRYSQNSYAASRTRMTSTQTNETSRTRIRRSAKSPPPMRKRSR